MASIRFESFNSQHPRKRVESHLLVVLSKDRERDFKSVLAERVGLVGRTKLVRK